MAIIYHLTSREAWAAAQAAGEYEAPSLADEGFIHCSGDEEQTLRVVERLYAGVSDLLVLDIDTEKLTVGAHGCAPLQWEISARSGEMYPHVYGKINLNAVVSVRYVTQGPDGKRSISGDGSNE